jgi:hypothetical protein
MLMKTPKTPEIDVDQMLADMMAGMVSSKIENANKRILDKNTEKMRRGRREDVDDRDYSR